MLDVLSEQLSSSDLQSLQLEIYKRRAKRISPTQLFNQYQNSRFTKPSPVDPRKHIAFDQLAYQIAEDVFEPIELSPLAPLGNCSVLGTVDQNKTISAIRNMEVVADPTNVMALEAARRRKILLKKNQKDKTVINLCSSHRVVRAQYFGKPNHYAHFNIFGLVSSGSDEGNFKFEINELTKQLSFYLELMTIDNDEFCFFSTEVLLTPLEKQLEALLVNYLLPVLTKQFPSITIRIDNERKNGLGYYQTFCFTINATNKNEELVHLVDGGFTSWTQQLLSNQKERLLISGIGSERICTLFSLRE